MLVSAWHLRVTLPGVERGLGAVLSLGPLHSPLQASHNAIASVVAESTEGSDTMGVADDPRSFSAHDLETLYGVWLAVNRDDD